MPRPDNRVAPMPRPDDRVAPMPRPARPHRRPGVLRRPGARDSQARRRAYGFAFQSVNLHYNQCHRLSPRDSQARRPAAGTPKLLGGRGPCFRRPRAWAGGLLFIRRSVVCSRPARGLVFGAHQAGTSTSESPISTRGDPQAHQGRPGPNGRRYALWGGGIPPCTCTRRGAPPAGRVARAGGPPRLSARPLLR